MLCAPVGVVDAVWVSGLRRRLAQLGELLLFRHPDHHARPLLRPSAGKTEGMAMSQGSQHPPRTEWPALLPAAPAARDCSSLQLTMLPVWS